MNIQHIPQAAKLLHLIFKSIKNIRIFKSI